MADYRAELDRVAAMRAVLAALEAQLAVLEEHSCLLPAARLAQAIDCIRLEISKAE